MSSLHVCPHLCFFVTSFAIWGTNPPDQVLYYCLLCVQAAQRQLQQQIDAAEQLQQDMEALKTENLEAWRQKYDLEGQLAAARANMEGMRGQAESMQQVGAQCVCRLMSSCPLRSPVHTTNVHAYPLTEPGPRKGLYQCTSPLSNLLLPYGCICHFRAPISCLNLDIIVSYRISPHSTL